MTDKRHQSHGESDLSDVTTDHDRIREWVEERHGKPATVKSTHAKDEVGILRIEFPDAPEPHDENLEAIPWEDFFRKFDDADLAFLYQEKTAGGEESRFFKFIRR